MKDEELEENTRDADEDDVYMISSGDEDCSKGMKSKKHWTGEFFVFKCHDFVFNSLMLIYGYR